MKNVEFYPKRLIIVASLFLGIPLAALIAKVADIHLPNGEEMVIQENAKKDPYIVYDDTKLPKIKLPKEEKKEKPIKEKPIKEKPKEVKKK